MTDAAAPPPEPPPDEAKPRPRAALLFGEPGVAQRLACAAFAWAVTVAPAAFSRAGGWSARLAAILALACGIAGPGLVPARRRLGRHVGISAFLALATLVWVLTPEALDVARIDAVRAGIGAIAWGVYAFSWGEPWRFRTEAPQDDAGGALRARATLPPLAVPIAAFGVLAAIAMLGVAWLVRDPSRALLAQAAGVGVAVALASAAAHVATARGKGRRSSSGAIPKEALRTIVALLLVATLGAVALVTRG